MCLMMDSQIGNWVGDCRILMESSLACLAVLRYRLILLVSGLNLRGFGMAVAGSRMGARPLYGRLRVDVAPLSRSSWTACVFQHAQAMSDCLALRYCWI